MKLGAVLGLVAPLLGLVIFKYWKLGPLTFREAFQFLFVQPEHRLLSAALSVSLMANAIVFTLYVNAHKDKIRQRYIFITTGSLRHRILIVKYLL